MDAELKEYIQLSMAQLAHEISRLSGVVANQSALINDINIKSTTRVAELQKDIDDIRGEIKNINEKVSDMNESQKLKWRDRESKDRIQAVVNNQISLVNKLLWAILGIVLSIFIGFVWQLIINGGLKGMIVP
jgi:uncharacterized coiled-coil protein SlyX